LVVVGIVSVNLMLRMQKWGAQRRNQPAENQGVMGEVAEQSASGAATAGMETEGGTEAAADATQGPAEQIEDASFSAGTEEQRVERLKTAYERTKMGLDAQAQGDWSGAMRNYLAAIDAAPGYGVAHYQLALVYIHRSEYPMALRSLTRALESDPNKAGYFLAMGQVFRVLSQYEPALTHVKRALELDSEIPNGHLVMAMCYLESGDPFRAIPSFRDALRREKDNTALWNNLGVAQVRAGQVKEAIRTFENTIEQFPDSTVAYQNLAFVLAQQESVHDVTVLLSDAASRFGSSRVLPWLSRREFDPIRRREEFERLERQFQMTTNEGTLGPMGIDRPLGDPSLNLLLQDASGSDESQ
jgi:tetratricopeptide (TPR) repeat protein